MNFLDDGGDCADDKNQVGYGYHKETKCSSHPKKSCHDVAKHVRKMLKTLMISDGDDGDDPNVRNLGYFK